ncbi:MAG: hypothetical protein J6328_07315, partial [Bacilli bacterium]|nr:hypothetical protein [Bacilli bacterium]
MATEKKINFKFIYVIVDVLIAFLVSFFGFLAFYQTAVFTEHLVPIVIYCGSIAIVTPIAFFIFKVYGIITRDVGIFECLRIMAVTIIIHLAGLISIIVIPVLPKISAYFFSWLLATIAVTFAHPTVRVIVRVLNLANVIAKKENTVPTIVIGAGATGKVVIDESRRNPKNHNQIVAVVDDDPNKIGGLFANIPVKGPIADIATIIDFTHAEEVIIAMSKISKEELHEVLSYLSSCNVRVRRMPLISEMEGPNDKRIIDVDLDDLLSRDPVVLDNAEVNQMLHGKSVLVTGAGGSIGSELVRQIFKT